MDLFVAARKYANAPSDIEAMLTFNEALAQEQSVDEIKKILSLDFELIAGLGLTRMSELRPENVDILLDLVVWKYHFGLDEEARKYLELAKGLAPHDLNVLQVEIFLSYGSEPESTLALCEAALSLFPCDEWLLGIRQKIEETGHIDEMRGPPINSVFREGFTDSP